MRRVLGSLLLTALLLPVMAWAAETKEKAPEVYAPGFAYYTLGAEAMPLVDLAGDSAQVAGGLFVLSDGYLSIGYEVDFDVLCSLPAGKGLTCLNSDLSVRWENRDKRLDGVFYTELREHPDGLLLGSDAGGPERPSLMMLDRDTGKIRWRLNGEILCEHRGTGIWIGGLTVDAEGNILVASNGKLHGYEGGQGTLTLLEPKNGLEMWRVSYLEDYGVTAFGDICVLGDGLVLYGWRGEQDRIVLYTDMQGAVRGWFTFDAWESGHDRVRLRLRPVSEDAVYLCGWETEENSAPYDPYDPMIDHDRSIYMMRLDENVLTHARREEAM